MADEKKQYIITEGILGYFHYHWSTTDKPYISLCGTETMKTSVPNEAWGVKTHIEEKYCEKCNCLRKGG